MRQIPLYRYARESGGMTVSREKPAVACTELIRLIAEDGFILTNGATTTPCIDVEDPSGWTEVISTESVAVDPNEATEVDYQNALREMGVTV